MVDAGLGVESESVAAVIHQRQKFVARLFLRSRKIPSMALVMAPECCFSTPRIIMQKWRASQITPTPTGSMISWMVCATCCVRRS